MKSYAPIAVFAFNRPLHLRQCLASLEENPEINHSEITIFVDGPRSDKERKTVSEVLEVARNFADRIPAEIIFSEENMGLAESVINGISHVLATNSRIIVVEDDLIVSKYFLKYCNDGLDKYQKTPEVASIHGFSYNLGTSVKEPYFLRGADCWGWATWKDRWEHLEQDSHKLLKQLKDMGLEGSFDLDGAYPYTRMLERQARNEISSWAIRWHASMYLANKLSFFPVQSMVMNTGTDGSGTHSGSTKNFEINFSNQQVILPNLIVGESTVARNALIKFLRRTHRIYPKYTLRWLYFGIKRRLLK
jgi:hypothetical protein